jgi:hypothetical protein
MNRWLARVVSVSCAMGMLASSPVMAADGPTADEIVDQMIAQDSFGFESGEVTLSLEIRSRRGDVRVRTLRARGDRKGDLRRSRVDIVDPPDVRGTAILLLEQSGERDDLQYIYLPEYKKAKRITGSQKNGSFLGSDLTYADLESRDTKDGKKTRLADGKVAGQAVYHVRIEVDDVESDYGHLDLYIHQKYHLPLKMEFFDRSKELTKTLFAKKIQKKGGKIVVSRMLLKNHKRGTQTVLQIDSMDPKATFTDTIFDKDALGR